MATLDGVAKGCKYMQSPLEGSILTRREWQVQRPEVGSASKARDQWMQGSGLRRPKLGD